MQPIEVACPKCHKTFPVEFSSDECDDRMLVSCDHCRYEKKLLVFKQERERQERERQEAEQAAALAAQRRRAEEDVAKRAAYERVAEHNRQIEAARQLAEATSRPSWEPSRASGPVPLPHYVGLSRFQAVLRALGILHLIGGCLATVMYAASAAVAKMPVVAAITALAGFVCSLAIMFVFFGFAEFVAAVRDIAINSWAIRKQQSE